MLKNGANFMKKLIFNKCIGINLGKTYLVTEKDNERLGNQKLDLTIL